MRKGLIIILAGFVLSPGLAGLPSSSPIQSCQCDPSACHCNTHDHGSGHEPMCAFANGGRCGIKSADLALSAIMGRYQFLVGETPHLPLLFSVQFKTIPATASGLAGYQQPPKPPPRPVV